MTTEERWVGVQTVATHLGVAKDSIYRWIEEQGLPAHRVGRLFRFKLSEIDDWVRRDNEQNNTPKFQTNQSKTKAHSRKRAGNG